MVEYLLCSEDHRRCWIKEVTRNQRNKDELVAILKDFPGINSPNYNNQPSHKVEHHVKGQVPVLQNDLLTKIKISGNLFFDLGPKVKSDGMS